MDRIRNFWIALFAASTAGTCLWISNLTAGHEYGGRWDVPLIKIP